MIFISFAIIFSTLMSAENSVG